MSWLSQSVGAQIAFADYSKSASRIIAHTYDITHKQGGAIFKCCLGAAAWRAFARK